MASCRMVLYESKMIFFLWVVSIMGGSRGKGCLGFAHWCFFCLFALTSQVHLVGTNLEFDSVAVQEIHQPKEPS